MSLIAIRESGPIAARQITVLRLSQGAAMDASGDIALNNAHRLGDGSDHSDVAFNSDFVDAGGYNASPDTPALVGADIFSREIAGSSFSKAKVSVDALTAFMQASLIFGLDYSTLIPLDTTQEISPSNGEVYLSTGPDRMLIDSTGGEGFWRPNVYTQDVKLFGATAFDDEITATIKSENLVAGEVFAIVQYTGESIVFMYDGFDYTEVGGVSSPSRIDGHAVVAATEDFDFRANVHEINISASLVMTFSNASIFRDFIIGVKITVSGGAAPTMDLPVGATIWTTTNLSAMVDGVYRVVAEIGADGTYDLYVSFKPTP